MFGKCVGSGCRGEHTKVKHAVPFVVRRGAHLSFRFWLPAKKKRWGTGQWKKNRARHAEQALHFFLVQPILFLWGYNSSLSLFFLCVYHTWAVATFFSFPCILGQSYETVILLDGLQTHLQENLRSTSLLRPINRNCNQHLHHHHQHYHLFFFFFFHRWRR